MIANGCAKMLLNNEAIQKLAEQNRTLFGWIKDKIDEITGNINDAYDEIDLSDDLDVYKAARIFERSFDEIRERWNKMLETANENKRAEQITGKKISAEGGTKFSRTEALAFDIEWDPDNKSHLTDQLKKYGYKIADMKPVFSFRFDGKNYAKKLENLLRERFNYKVETKDYGTVLFDRTGVGNLRQHVENDAQAAAVIASPYVVKRGKAITGHKNHKGNGYPTVTFAAPVEINGKIGNEAVTVMYSTKNRVHAVEILSPDGTEFVIEIEKDAESTTPVASPKGAVNPTDSTSKNSLTQKPNKSKSQNQKFQKLDSTGKELTDGQQEYFADSKIRDADGRLKVMYRGGNGDFTVFDRKKSSYSNLYGRGFYFTESKEHAEQYGKARAFYLNITNPLTPGSKTITRKQLRAFLQEVADNEDYGIENYGYNATVDSILAELKGKDDFSALQDINTTCIGDLVAAVELFNEVNGTDFDGIVTPTETVTFSSEQSKETSNKNPTSNPDIRFQKLGFSETAEEQQARKESFDNLKAENRILRARAEYWKAQTRKTKERTVRQQDTDRLANELLRKYESKADKAEVKEAYTPDEGNEYNTKEIEAMKATGLGTNTCSQPRFFV